VRYILRRLGFYLLAAYAALTLGFLIPRMMPGDRVAAMVARFQGQLKPDAIQTLREVLGLTQEPIWTQYAKYTAHVFQGDLGTSIAYFPSPVTQVIGSGLLWTLLLAGLATQPAGRDRRLEARQSDRFGIAARVDFHRFVPVFLSGDDGAVLF